MRGVRTIEESGMHFICPENGSFEIEKYTQTSKVHHVRSVEFLLKRNGAVLFIEAKSSIPGTDGEGFQEYIAAVTEKFIHSLGMYVAVLLKRRKVTGEWELPDSLKQVDLSAVQCKFVLVVNGASPNILLNVEDALRTSMYPVQQIAKFESHPIAIDDVKARQKGLIV